MCQGCPQLTGYPLDVYTAALERSTPAARREFVKVAAPSLLVLLGPLLDRFDREERAHEPA